MIGSQGRKSGDQWRIYASRPCLARVQSSSRASLLLRLHKICRNTRPHSSEQTVAPRLAAEQAKQSSRDASDARVDEMQALKVQSYAVEQAKQSKSHSNASHLSSDGFLPPPPNAHHVAPALSNAAVNGYTSYAIPKATFSNQDRFIFFAGLEGTGHHMMSAIFKEKGQSLII